MKAMKAKKADELLDFLKEAIKAKKAEEANEDRTLTMHESMGLRKDGSCKSVTYTKVTKTLEATKAMKTMKGTKTMKTMKAK